MNCRNSVSIMVPASSANVGLGYDIWCLGLEKPQLKVSCIQKSSIGIDLDVEGSSVFPAGRVPGYAGLVALRAFLKEHKIGDGAHLLYEDQGYPVGGLGRSGAEAVGAIMAAAVLYSVKLSREDIVIAASKGEPREHKDNVAASTNGRFTVIAPNNPSTNKPSIDFYDVPNDLGIAIGFSSHQKTGGTEAGREVFKSPVASNDFVAQMGIVSAATAALVTGNTNRFLELVWGDKVHQPRRARVGFYGEFTDTDFGTLQKTLYGGFGVAWNVSGAGPNMQVLYNKTQYPLGISAVLSPVVVPWFAEKGIEMKLQDMQIAHEGAYDYAKKHYQY